MVTNNGKYIGYVFTPFWAVATYCNIMGFLASVAEGQD
jgi:hypothetical protein